MITKPRRATLFPMRGVMPRVAFALLLACACVQSSGQSQPAYSIDFHAISAGGRTLANNCFRLSGTVGQAAPGYSSNGSAALYAGFWSTPARAVDEVFFTGFEDC